MRADPVYGTDRGFDADAWIGRLEASGLDRVEISAETLRGAVEAAHGRLLPAEFARLQPGFRHVLISFRGLHGRAIAAGQARGPFAIVPELSGLFLPVLWRVEGREWFRVAGFRDASAAVYGASALHRAPAWIVPHDGSAQGWARADERIMHRVLGGAGMEQGRIVGSAMLVWRRRPSLADVRAS